MSSNVRILEQPEKSFRFRYDSEKRLNVSIAGISTNDEIHTYPTIMVRNYTGPVCVFISCVTYTMPYRQHQHKAFSTDDMDMNTSSRFGTYRKKAVINGCGTIELKDIGIEYVKNDEIVESLTERRNGNINPYNTDWDHMNEPKVIDANNIRLCFQVIGLGNTDRKCIGTAISTPISNKKLSSILKIIDVRPRSASILGGDKVILMCDRVSYQDIAVRIYEENAQKQVIWAETLSEEDLMVHHQHNILFKIPRYHNISARRPRRCFIQLYRPSDGETSESILFELQPVRQSNTRPAVMEMTKEITTEMKTELMLEMEEMSLDKL